MADITKKPAEGSAGNLSRNQALSGFTGAV